MASEQRLAREEAQRELDAEEIAHEFHATYERLAPRYGYETRKASAVDWADVPQQNKDLMIGVVNDLLRRTVVLPRWMGVPEAENARLTAALDAREREVAGLNAIQDEAERELVRLTDALHEIETAHRRTTTPRQPRAGRPCAWCGGDWDTHHMDCPLVIARRALAASPQRPATGEGA